MSVHRVTFLALALLVAAATAGAVPPPDCYPYCSSADLSGADLRWALLTGALLRRADLSDADLRWADLGGGRPANLSAADLSGADLRWADLSGARLTAVDLSGADLRWANLSDADFHYADLNDADLRWANMANVRGCPWHVDDPTLFSDC